MMKRIEEINQMSAKDVAKIIEKCIGDVCQFCAHQNAKSCSHQSCVKGVEEWLNQESVI